MARTWPLTDKKSMGFLSDSNRARAVMHAGIAEPRWRGKRSRHSQRMRNPQFYGSGKRPMLVNKDLSDMASEWLLGYKR